MGILILVVAGIFFFSNNSKIYNLTEEFGLTGKVVDYGVYGEERSYDDILSEFMDKYPQISRDEKVHFIFGDSEEINIFSYEEITRGNIQISLGGKNQRLDVKDIDFSNQKLKPSGSKVKVILEQKSYEFDLEEDESVYFIVKGSELNG